MSADRRAIHPVFDFHAIHEEAVNALALGDRVGRKHGVAHLRDDLPDRAFREFRIKPGDRA